MGDWNCLFECVRFRGRLLHPRKARVRNDGGGAHPRYEGKKGVFAINERVCNEDKIEGGLKI